MRYINEQWLSNTLHKVLDFLPNTLSGNRLKVSVLNLDGGQVTLGGGETSVVVQTTLTGNLCPVANCSWGGGITCNVMRGTITFVFEVPAPQGGQLNWLSAAI